MIKRNLVYRLINNISYLTKNKLENIFFALLRFLFLTCEKNMQFERTKEVLSPVSDILITNISAIREALKPSARLHARQ